MITKENIDFCFDDLSREQIELAFESSSDYVLFELHNFNAGSYSSIEPKEFNEADECRARNEGQLFIDKSAFLELFKESNSVNPFLIQLL